MSQYTDDIFTCAAACYILNKSKLDNTPKVRPDQSSSQPCLSMNRTFPAYDALGHWAIKKNNSGTSLAYHYDIQEQINL